MSSTKKNLKLVNNEAGMAAILITMIMMVVVSIIVLGYTQISDRVQLASSSRQLSTEAFYAAESGVNDAAYALKADPNMSSMLNCNDWAGTNYNGAYPNPVISNKGPVEYTCLIINTSPAQINYPAYTDHSTVANIQVQPGNTVGSLNFSWEAQPNIYPLDFSTCKFSNNFQPGSSPPACTPKNNSTISSAGVLRLDIVPWVSGESNDNLASSVMTLFLVPVNDPANPAIPNSTSYNVNNQGQVLPVNCSPNMNNSLDDGCSINIDNIPNINQAYIRLLSIYTKDNVQVQAYNSSDGSGNAMPIVNSQAVIDSTGKANNVIQRIQVSVPLQSLGGPSYAIQSTDSICKRFVEVPGGSPETTFTPPTSYPLPGNTNVASCFPNS